MRTYEDIDREQAVYIKEVNDILAAMRDKCCRWWRYSVSHCTLLLVVGDVFGEDNLVLTLSGCERISGPVIWPRQELEVVWHCDRTREHNVWEYVLRDATAGFEADPGSFAWQRNLDVLNNGLTKTWTIQGAA